LGKPSEAPVKRAPCQPVAAHCFEEIDYLDLAELVKAEKGATVVTPEEDFLGDGISPRDRGPGDPRLQQIGETDSSSRVRPQ